MSSEEDENVEGIENIPVDESDPVFRSVAEADVSLDEMMSLACRQGKLDIVELLLESGAHVDYRNKAGNTPLLEACSQGHVDVARYLLDHQASIDAPTETTSDSALTWACTLGNEAIVSLLLERKANVEHRTKDGCTALMFAALAGHVKVAAMLLDHCAEINVESDSNKDSPLTFACWKGHCDVVELLLLRSANIEHRTKEGFTPLMFAALGGHTDVAAKLLEQGAKVNVPSGSNNDIPLTSACWKGHHDVVKLLLEYHSNIEHRTKDGCTPLMLAAREGHYSVAKLILDSRAEVNKPSGSENNIPLTLACWKGHTKVVELLLDHKSNIEHRNKAGCTPLMLAAREGHVETTHLLLSRGAEINKPSGSNDDTPLTLACWKGHVGVVELLLKHSSKVDHQTKTGCTPLMEATREGHVAVAKLLLEHSADVELPDNYGQSPLFMACWKGHRDVAELLLEHSANRDCRTKTGITPLFQACRENHVEVVKLLLDYGASVNATFPNSRENPLTLACEKGHAELVSLLLRRSANIECHTKKGCTPFHLSCKEGHLAIAIALQVRGAETEAPDYRNNSPLVSTMKNGHSEVLEWLLNVVDHLPSEEQCQKCLLAPIEDKDRHEELMLGRTKCYDLILRCKKTKEQKVQRNTELLLKELENEKERENNRKQKAAAKRRDKRRRRKAAKENEQIKETKEGTPLENRPQEEAEPPESGDSSNNEDDECTKQGLQDKAKRYNGDIDHISHKNKQRKETNSKQNNRQDSREIVDSSRGRGKLNIDHEASKNVVGSNDRQHHQNQDSPNDYENKKSAENPKGKNSKKKSDEINSTSKEDKKKINCQSNKNREEKDVEGKRNSCHGMTISSILSDDKQEKPKREPPQKQNTNINTTRTPITSSNSNPPPPPPTPNKPAENVKTDRINATNTGHPVSPREKSRAHASPKSSPEIDKNLECDKNVKRRSKEFSEGSEGGSPGEPVKHKVVSRASTTYGQSSVVAKVAKVTQNDNDREQKPLHSPRTKQVQQQSLKEDSWKEVTRSTNSKTMVVQLTAPNALCGRVIGRGGTKINSITEESGAQITIGKPEPKAPTDRVITIKGSTKSVQRAKFLVTQALNTPSTIAQTTAATHPSSIIANGCPEYGSTSSVAGVRGNFAAIPSASSEWPTIAQANTMTTTTATAKPVLKSVGSEEKMSPETITPEVTTQEPRQTHARSLSSGSSDSGPSVKGVQTKPLTVAKTTAAWATQSPWKPHRPFVTQSIGVSTSAITTCVSSSYTISNGPIDRNTLVSSSYTSEKLVQGRAGSENSLSFTNSTSGNVNAGLVRSKYDGTKVKVAVATVAASTSAETTTTQRDRVAPGRPLESVSNSVNYDTVWSNNRQHQGNSESVVSGPFGAIGDIPSTNSVFQESSTSFSSASRKEPLLSEPLVCTTNTATFSSSSSGSAPMFYSPWSTQPTGISDIGRDNAFSSNNNKYQRPLPGMELFTGSNSLFSGQLPPYPWSSGEDADQTDRGRSISWSGQGDFESNGLSSLTISKGKSPPQNHKPGSETSIGMTSDLASDQRPLSSSWNSWGQAPSQALPSALSVVCDDDPPDKQAWNNSDSTSSSQSSSRQELSSIMDNDGTATSTGVWNSSAFNDNNLTPTPHATHNSSSLPHPDQGNQWSSNRGAFSAPSSPSLTRSQSQPDPCSNSIARPSVDDSAVRTWNTKHKSPRSQSSSDHPTAWEQNAQTARRSSVDISQSFSGDTGISNSPWQYPPRPHEMYQQHGYAGRDQWNESHFASTGTTDVSNILKRLTLEKYLPVFQDNKITGSRLSQMSEKDLENLGIPKGPRLKLLHAFNVTRSTTWPTMNNSFSTTGNGYIKTADHQPNIVAQPSNKVKQCPSILENHNHVHAHTEPGMTPLALKKAVQKQDFEQRQQHQQMVHSNHGNQPLLSLMSPGRGVHQAQPTVHSHHNQNHNEYSGALPPRPHSASGNLNSAQVFPTNSSNHVEQFPFGAQQGSYVNHMAYTQQVYYPGGYYYYYPQQ